jgi:hypothetical protein
MRSASASSAATSAPPSHPPSGSAHSSDRCSLPSIRQTGPSGPAGAAASASTVTRPLGPAPAAAASGADSAPGPASVQVATAYQAGTPGGRVVSAYGGAGTASTSPPPWSTGSNGPSGEPARWTR